MKILAIGLILIALAPVAIWLYLEHVGNPRVAKELIDDPDGSRARKVMLLTLPGGRQLPVNYYAEGEMLYAAADGRWWRQLVGEGREVEVFVRGTSRKGIARAVRDDPEYTERIFARLRPTAIKGFGTLIEIRPQTTQAP